MRITLTTKTLERLDSLTHWLNVKLGLPLRTFDNPQRQVTFIFPTYVQPKSELIKEIRQGLEELRRDEQRGFRMPRLRLRLRRKQPDTKRFKFVGEAHREPFEPGTGKA